MAKRIQQAITVRVVHDGREISQAQMQNLIINSAVIDRIVNSVADRSVDIPYEASQSAS